MSSQDQVVLNDRYELHRRIARVTDDLRNIQQELNCAAMQAPSDPELMETLNSLSETEPIDTMRCPLARPLCREAEPVLELKATGHWAACHFA